MSETFPILSSPISNDMNNDTYYFFVNDNGQLKQVDKDIVKNYLGTITWDNLSDKPFVSLDENMFTIENSKLSITHDHTHDNKTDVLDNLSVNAEGTLLFNGEEISGSGIGTGGKLITIYDDNVEYAAEDIVIYENSLYMRISDGIDTTWNSDNWIKISDSDAIDGANAYVHIKYSANQPTSDGDISNIPNDYIGIYSGTSSTAPISHFSYTWFKIKGEDGIDGATGEKGEDGASAYEVAVKNGYTGTETQWLASLKGADGVTTVTTSKVDMTCTFTASGWSSTVPYTQTVSVDGITEELNPRIDVIISDNLVTGKSEEIAFSCFTKAITGNGTITAYCYENKPEVDLNIMIEVV